MSAQVKDNNGYVEISDNPLSRVGVFDYHGSEIDAPDKSRMYRVYRPAEELSSDECIQSFRGVPLVNDHLMLGEGQTDPAKKGIEGTIGDKVYFKDGTLYGNLRLYTDKIKKLVANGKKDLSLGYYSRYDFTPGTWQGQTYDAVQRFISGNHIALVDSGRMGDTVSVLDHATPNNLTITFDHKALQMTVDKDTITEIVAAALLPLKATMDAQAATIAKLQATLDAEAEEEKEKEEDKVATEDEEAEEEEKDDKDDKKETMDAAAITALVRKEMVAKDELVKLSAPLVGTFDHSAMSSTEVAVYAAEKLNLSGDPETALRAYAKGLNVKPTATQDAQAEPVGDNQLRAGAYN